MATYKGTAVQSQKQEFKQAIEIDTINSSLTVSGNVISAISPSENNHLTNKVYVDTSVSNLVDSAPALLNTLNEISAAIGDDANFASSIQTQINTKSPLASPTFTGTVTVPTPSNTTDAATKDYVDVTSTAKAAALSIALG
jgi:hypothetical protein